MPSLLADPHRFYLYRHIQVAISGTDYIVWRETEPAFNISFFSGLISDLSDQLIAD
jgi:hypothetical protein